MSKAPFPAPSSQFERYFSSLSVLICKEKLLARRQPLATHQLNDSQVTAEAPFPEFSSRLVTSCPKLARAYIPFSSKHSLTCTFLNKPQVSAFLDHSASAQPSSFIQQTYLKFCSCQHTFQAFHNNSKYTHILNGHHKLPSEKPMLSTWLEGRTPGTNWITHKVWDSWTSRVFFVCPIKKSLPRGCRCLPENAHRSIAPKTSQSTVRSAAGDAFLFKAHCGQMQKPPSVDALSEGESSGIASCSHVDVPKQGLVVGLSRASSYCKYSQPRLISIRELAHRPAVCSLDARCPCQMGRNLRKYELLSYKRSAKSHTPAGNAKQPDPYTPYM